MEQSRDQSTVVTELRRGFATGRSHEQQWRFTQLEGLRRLLTRHETELTDAICQDVGKPAHEVRLFELQPLINEIDHTLANLGVWLMPRRVGVPLNTQPATAEVHPQPKGVVLVLSPWNYPLQLLLSPTIGALAAGNAVLLKPSEVAPHTAHLMARLIPQYLDPELVRVVTGGVEETTRLLTERFDHIIYTGSTAVGKIVMRAAAEHLTPVTLELGAKSPVFVDASVDPAAAARRIVWAKFTNAGQTCVSPDHVLVTPDAKDRLLTELARAIRTFFGEEPRQSPDFGRIVNDKHFERLSGLLDSGRAVVGGQQDAAGRYLAPTVLVDVDPDSPVMAEEIFGPILPVLEVADASAAIEFITARPHPLALYVFSDDSATREAFRERTLSGGLVFNAALIHLSIPDLPFGGVGDSGMGHYHGRFSVDTFSHLRAVFGKPLQPDTLEVVYPPVNDLRRRLMKLVRLTPR
ncbi:aldehyde dehydrogenase family protein [Naumannella sp. ID2617S]|nr:aldehyde dehydrogenase family protein [Naumannella sp. ID2617S]